ncbi:MAG TPA: hypothetical protein VKV28_00405 [Candidatus Binataceae bacterium]|nr:hypothetical protein [Candidatus Binataceae bacterium]
MNATVTARLEVSRRAARLRELLSIRLLPLIVLCSIVVVVAHHLTEPFALHLSAYHSGFITLAAFVFAGWYSVRKRFTWLGLHMLVLAQRVTPAPLFRLVRFWDRLETRRAIHVAAGILALLPLWWHTQTHLMGPLETVLAFAVVTLLASGLFGALLQDFLPTAMTHRAAREVRLGDVESAINLLFAQAEEKILGHSEALIGAYLGHVKPILVGTWPRRALLAASLRGRDAGVSCAAELARYRGQLTQDGELWDELSALAAHKVNLEQNAFNLEFGTRWLGFHLAIAALTGVLVVFHVLAVFYFAGL